MMLKWVKFFCPVSFDFLIFTYLKIVLRGTAVDLQELVQSKFEITNFSLVYNQVRQSALIQRARFQMTTNPEVAAKTRIRIHSGWQRNVINLKKESRKRKDREISYCLFLVKYLLPVFSDGKGKIKRRREEY